ncbi:hypothetical protein ACFYUV_38175 [Nonomuraea sp. NPDC003560]|uniref:hypothetical protein n=1 Tax=Nonomuraea sp. NPDC003560 TaxID=3364341 RepID=UPI0036BCE904
MAMHVQVETADGPPTSDGWSVTVQTGEASWRCDCGAGHRATWTRSWPRRRSTSMSILSA